MTRHVILIRHAKSDWPDLDLDLEDHDRPLSPRGKTSAPRIGAWLTARGFAPDAVLISSARRTQETWRGMAEHIPGAPQLEIRPELYLAEPAAILAAVRSSDTERLAVIGHNPGIGALAWSLAETPPDHAKFGLFPTGATLVLHFDVERLSDVSPGAGRVEGFAVPRELPDPT